MKTNRYQHNLIIKPKDIVPSHPDFKVDGVFNAGAIEFNNQILLVLRVAESYIVKDPNILEIPTYNNGQIETITFNKKEDSNKYDFTDARHPFYKGTKEVVCLTSVSHFRLACSNDGFTFVVDEKPFMLPAGKYETWGIEDPRVVKIDDEYYINYTGCSKMGAMTILAKTSDFKQVIRLGVIFGPENKDVCLFNEKINGYYYAYHRPVPKAFGNPDIWVASSTDLLRFGNHEYLLGVNPESHWENGRIGGGAPAIKTEVGWLHIYHAADLNNRYCLGAFMSDLNDPTNIIGKMEQPLLEPVENYEVEGFFGNVVFSCGVVQKGNDLFVYYGAADECIGVVTYNVNELIGEIMT